MQLVLAALLIALGTPAIAQESVAFFGVTLLDSSLQSAELGAAPAEQTRLEMLEELIADRFTQEGYELLDLAPVAADLDRVVNPAKCYGCDVRMADKLGADFILVGEVQKVSNLILTMNLQMRDPGTGQTVKGRVVDIRSNTDEAWLRGMKYILKTAFFPPEGK
ncbi:DUF3280 domain-containing protein [Pseudooceanicola sp. HF7]|uniref:DUF3280 domain-containing protein n=1 Tax=Pseudooceanicola sp. HF7 TaxID=2721560 RepID=UPI001431E032|nr:DUF3280 domain-containing protein [Pseudooceanicola sp. HF7]NIZ09406.1 DUF3280 domain-containing protein [Pseudooceanicola sp. HF7]